MILISYDISSDKLRTKFSKYLEKYGHRIQYSVFQIDNSEKMLDNIMCDIENTFSKRFNECDSVYIFKMSQNCKVKRFGYARHDEEDIIII